MGEGGQGERGRGGGGSRKGCNCSCYFPARWVSSRDQLFLLISPTELHPAQLVTQPVLYEGSQREGRAWIWQGGLLVHASRLPGEAYLSGLRQEEEEGHPCLPVGWSHV